MLGSIISLSDFSVYLCIWEIEDTFDIKHAHTMQANRFLALHVSFWMRSGSLAMMFVQFIMNEKEIINALQK